VALDGNGLPIHGVIGGRMAWQLAQPPSPDAQSLKATLSWSDALAELFAVFPFRHDLDYEATIAADRLTISVTVSACGEDTVPVAFGFHPYVSLPGIPRERWLVELCSLRELTLDANQIPVAPGEQRHAHCFELAEQNFDDGFDSVPTPASFAVMGAGRSITVEFLEGYTHAQLYAPPTGQFICFEPMTAATNALRSGSGLRLLAPGESHRATFAVSVTRQPLG
jgi:aldose 1-epimerase